MESVVARDVKGIIERNIHFSKGDAGRVLLVGSEPRYAGALVLAAMAALRSGVDSVRVIAPEPTATILKQYPDLVSLSLPGTTLAERHVATIKKQAETASVLLIGPGLGIGKAEWLNALLDGMQTPVVLDADATKEADISRLTRSIILANGRESAVLPKEPGENTFIIKGMIDYIRASQEFSVPGGHPRATVNGTGDVLAGVVAGIRAQACEPVVAAKAGCFILKRAEEAAANSLYFGFLASDLLTIIPRVMNEHRLFRVTKHQPSEMKKALKEGSSLWSWRRT